MTLNRKSFGVNTRLLICFQDRTMESEAWKGAVRDSYQQWKYNAVHKDIKNYFTVFQKSSLANPSRRSPSL